VAAEPGIHVSLSDSETLKEGDSVMQGTPVGRWRSK
jgi:hypothetical protein